VSSCEVERIAEERYEANKKRIAEIDQAKRN
jgi:hypothetical protein